MRTPLRVLTATVLLAGLTVVAPNPAHADEIRDGQWYLSELHVADAHKLSTGAGVRIGIIDTGVSAEHPDLTGAVKGADGVEGAGDPLVDPVDHGTGVAAVAVGRGDDAGVLGVAPEAEVVSVGLDPRTEPAMVGDLLSRAITALLKDRVDVIMVTVPFELPADLRSLENPAKSAGVPVVVGSGIPLDGAVTVVGTDQEGRRWQGTPPLSPGADFVVADPAVNIPRASAKGNYAAPGDDLGFATAMVTGSLALLKARWPQAEGDVLRELLSQQGTVGVPEGGYDEQLGFGVVDPGKLLRAEIPGMDPVDPSQPGTDQGAGGQTDSADAIDTSAANGTLASIVAAVGLLLLAAMVVTTRTVDARMRRRLVATAGGTIDPPMELGPPTASHTGTAGVYRSSGATPPGGVPAPRDGGR